MPSKASVGFVLASFLGVIFSVYAATSNEVKNEIKSKVTASKETEALHPQWWPRDPLETTT